VEAGPAATGTFTAALSADVAGLDPALLTDSNSLLVTSQVYETLVAFESGGSKPEPALAESWSVSADGKTWTFNLRPGVKFHDGSSLDAAAVVTNIQRWWDPANPYHGDDVFDTFGALFNGFKGDQGCLLAAVSASGPLQVQVVTTQPEGQLLSRLAMDAFGIATPAASGQYASASSARAHCCWQIPGITSGRCEPDYWAAAGAGRKDFPGNSKRGPRYDAGFRRCKRRRAQRRPIAAAANPDLRLWRLSSSVGYLGINEHSPLGIRWCAGSLRDQSSGPDQPPQYRQPGRRMFLPPSSGL
jgi:hypothetical protein